MDKKTIKLTESDIENIVKKVITEQKKRNKNTPDWKGSYSGELNFEFVDVGKPPIAVNVTEYNFDVRYTSSLSKVGRSMPDEDNGIMINIPMYNIQGGSLPYADNMVMPYFDKYPEANVQFKKIVKDFIEYINAGGGDKLINVTIKGSADSGKPTLQWPSGYSKLDHPSAKPYNGKTDPKEMNQYLADMRANLYAQALINSVKELTGFDLKINVLKGDNFYGQGEGKRGIEFRKITLTPNADKLRVPEKSIESGTSTPGQLVKNGGIPYIVDVYLEGQTENMKGYKVMDSKGYERLALDYDEVIIEKNIPDNPKHIVLSSQVKGGSFYVEDRLVGKILPISKQPVSFDDMQKTVTGPIRAFAGPWTTVWGQGTHNINGVEKKVGYIVDTYFLFF